MNLSIKTFNTKSILLNNVNKLSFYKMAYLSYFITFDSDENVPTHPNENQLRNMKQAKCSFFRYYYFNKKTYSMNSFF